MADATSTQVAAIARGIAAGAIIAGSAAALYAERGTLRTGMNSLWHARPTWVAAGAALEFVSMAAFVLLQHGLLTAAGARPAIAAVGAPVPWGKLVLAWGAGAGASTFSPTPFGLGVVEVALIAALAAAGISSPQAVGAVLLYRIMTFKLAGLIWIMYLHLRQRGRTG